MSEASEILPKKVGESVKDVSKIDINIEIQEKDNLNIENE